MYRIWLCTTVCKQTTFKKNLEDKGLVEDRAEVFALDFGFKLLLLVWKQVNFYIWVRCAANIHSRKILSLKNSNYQLLTPNEC